LEKISADKNEPPIVLRRMKSMPSVTSPPVLHRSSSFQTSDSGQIDSPVSFVTPQVKKSQSDDSGFRRLTFNSPEEDVMERIDRGPKITFDLENIAFSRELTKELDLDLGFPDLSDNITNDGCSDTISSPSLWERRRKKQGLGSQPNIGDSKSYAAAKSFKFDTETGLFSLLDEEVETTRQDTYNIVACAYHGSNSSVYKVSDNSSQKEMALKSIDIQTPSARRMIYLEIKILRSLQHPNIVKFYDVAFNPKTSTISILLEWMESGCLTDLVKISGPLKPARISKVARDILSALSYLHGKLIIHRDIKPDNVLLAADAAKLADFGIAKVTTEKDVFDSQEIGTLNYMAPERLNAQDYDFSSDVWSFGVMIYYLAEGKTKYSGFDTLTALIDKICYKKDLPALSDSHPKQLQDFVKSCCAFEKDKRPTCKGLLSSKLLKRKAESCVVS